jgi:AcrR family transcriptional regulator
MNRTSRPRHSAEGGYQRGEETRARIICAAIRLFGDLGFDGASTRDIAASAGVNAPALQYYFDNKEGVYAACTQHIIDRVWVQIATPVEAAELALADAASGDETLIEAYWAIQDRIIDFMFNSREADEWRLFMAREQAGLGPAVGFKLLNDGVNRRMVAVKSGIVGRLLGQPAADEDTLIRTMALGGAAHVFHVMRRNAFKALGWEDVDSERLARIRKIVRLQTVQLLSAMVQERDERAKSDSLGSRRSAARSGAKPGAAQGTRGTAPDRGHSEGNAA